LDETGVFASEEIGGWGLGIEDIEPLMNTNGKTGSRKGAKDAKKEVYILGRIMERIRETGSRIQNKEARINTDFDGHRGHRGNQGLG